MTFQPGDRIKHPLRGPAVVEKGSDAEGFVRLRLERSGDLLRMRPEVVEQWQKGVQGPKYARMRPPRRGRIRRVKH